MLKTQKMKIIFFAFILLFGINMGFAQTELDALRFSRQGNFITARSAALGGAFNAVGGDISSLSGNPAGLGIYRKGEFVISNNFFSTRSQSEFLSENTMANRFGLGLGTLGLVGAVKLKNAERHHWKFLNFGIGYNRLSNFNLKTNFSGINKENSMLDYFVQRANRSGGTAPSNLDPFFENLAYQTYLINPVDSIDSLHYSGVVNSGGVLQRRSSLQKGSGGEFVMSMAGNYNEKLFFGATLGIVFLRYSENSTFEERDDQDSIPDFQKFNFNQDVTTEGKGVNIKAGIIYKPFDWIRLGASVHSPMLLTMDDRYSSRMNSTFDNGQGYEYEAEGVYEYEFFSPFKVGAGMAVILRKQLLITADYEYTDYREMNFTGNGDPFFNVNSGIQSRFAARGNVKGGLEWRLGKVYVRGGYGWYGSPMNSGLAVKGADFSKQNYTGGLGIRDEHYFLDITYSLIQTKQFYRPYSLTGQLVPGAREKIDAHELMVTFGVRF